MQTNDSERNNDMTNPLKLPSTFRKLGSRGNYAIVSDHRGDVTANLQHERFKIVSLERRSKSQTSCITVCQFHHHPFGVSVSLMNKSQNPWSDNSWQSLHSFIHKKKHTFG